MGRGPVLGGGVDLQCGCFSVKMKELGLVGGGVRGKILCVDPPMSQF